MVTSLVTCKNFGLLINENNEIVIGEGWKSNANA